MARTFFARFLERYLEYYLSRELSAHVGRDRRFTNLDAHSEFKAALRQHCYETARIVEDFAGQWRSKTNWENLEISRSDAARFVGHAFKKLRAELQRRGGDANAA